MSRAKFDVLDHDALLKRLQTQVAAAKAHDTAYKRLVTALKDTEEPGKLDAEYEELTTEMYKAAQPKTHHFVVVLKANGTR